MKTSQLAAFGLLGLTGITGAARADVTLDYTLTGRVSTIKKPVLQENLSVAVTPQRSRTNVSVDMKGMMSAMDVSPSDLPLGKGKVPDNFALTVIERLDDDKYISYNSQEPKTFETSSLRGVFRTMRFDPWTQFKLSPVLADEEMPSFTPEQRQRLGREIRAVQAPYIGKVWKTYFRALTERRTFEGIEAQGYRMTWLINAGGIRPDDAEWLQVAFEWWMAPLLPGDDAIQSFNKAALGLRPKSGWPTTSLWLNEMLPVMWESLPDEIHDAAATLHAPDNSFVGTPLRLYVTATPPPMQRALSGEFRFELALAKRDTSPVSDTLFQAPADRKETPLQSPFEKIQKAVKDQMGDMDYWLPQNSGFSWQAWHEYQRATNPVLPLPIQPAAQPQR